MRDTIFALATAPGRSAVAILRLSGDRSRDALLRLTGRLPPPRRATLRTLRHGGEALDQALVLWLPGPGSFSGEDMAEFHIHGGAAVVEACCNALTALGLRTAEPGEFTRRAFEAGRLELSEAEAVADLVDAETDAQRRQALAHLGGAQHRRSERWREQLLSALALLEAQIDFPDEEVPADIARDAMRPLEELKAELEVVLADVRGERVREGVRIAIIGAPNAGKSSLLNALAGRDAAIVTPIAGTTRDVIEAPMVLGGYKATLADTAGLRETTDVVEMEGVRRARAWAEGADLRLLAAEPAGREDLGVFTGLLRPGDFLVATKADLGARGAGELERLAKAAGLAGFSTSVQDEGTIVTLRRALEAWVTQALAGADAPAITRERHRWLLGEGLSHLGRALGRPSGDAELIAEDVRLTVRALERLSGRIDSEAVLDRVFSTFCIGK